MAICMQSTLYQNISKPLALPSILSLPFPTYHSPLEINLNPIFEHLSDDETSMKNDEEHPQKVYTKGSWSQEEDNLLKKAVQSQSPILWDLVAEKVPGRTPIQCLSLIHI